MGLQISCDFHTEVPEESGLRENQEEPRRVFHDLARRRECRIEEGHLMADHVHMLVSILPKYSVAEVIGFIKANEALNNH